MPHPITQRRRVLDQIAHRPTDFVPMARLDFEGDVAERLDGHYGGAGWREVVHENNHIEGLSALHTYGHPVPDEQAIFTDVFGSRWRNDRRTLHLEEGVLTEPTLDGFRFPEAREFFRDNWREEVTAQAARHPDKLVIVGVGFGMFVKTWILRGFENAMTDAIAEPAFYEELLERICQLHLDILDRLLTLPVDGVIFDGDWGDQRGIMIGPERFRRFIKPRKARLYDRVHAAGKLAFNHSCGNIQDIIGDLIDIGLDVLQSVQPEAMDPYQLKKRFGENLTFWGGLGSQHTVPFGTPQEIRAEVRHLCAEMAAGGGYILGPAKSLQPETPTENAAAVVEAFLAEVGVTLS